MPKAWVVTVRRWVGLGGGRNERRISRKTEIVGVHGRRHASPETYNFSESALSTKNPRLSPGVLRFNGMPASGRHYPQAATVLATSWYSSIWSKFM